MAAATFTLLAMTHASYAAIIHRYSFNGDTHDSVGSEDGVLMGNAMVSGNQLVLDGTDGTYLYLPVGDTIGNLTNCTIEGWATWGAFQNPWSRIFDFGNGPLENMFLTPRCGGPDKLRYAITIGGSGGEQQTTALKAFPVGAQTHFAVTVDKDFGITTLYVNGKPWVIEFGDPTTLYDFNMAPAGNYLGKSQYQDPYFLGSIKEFRIYDAVLSMDDVYNSYLAGPDAP
jgi:hypothetical protein